MKIRVSLCTLLISFFVFTQGGISQLNRGESQQFAKGYVYEDVNQNGEKDQDESGIAGVMVSNQREVVVTDKEGRYKLPIKNRSIIFVSKPAGYVLRQNEHNLPQFYYIHQPEGSLNLQYAGLEPTGKLPDPLNFGLIPSQKKKSFKAIIFGDPQPRNDQELSYYRDDVVSELADVDANLVLVLGDIMFDDLSMYDRYNRIMKTLDMPVYNLFGNHDINYDAVGNAYARETFKKYYGPTYFSFEYGDIHFIALNNIDYLGIENESGPYRGYLDDKQLEWMENTLEHVEKDKRVVILSHIPLYSDDGKGNKKNTVNRERLIDLIEDRNKALYLSAHRHRIFHDFLGEEVSRIKSDPMHHIALAAASGAWWDGPRNESGIPVATQRDGVPNGYHIFKFDGITYKERYKGAGHAADYQMRIESPKSSMRLEEFSNSELLVNVFNGNKNSEVFFKIGDKNNWSEMMRMEKHYSPYYDEIMEGYRKPGHTNHFWKADLPDLDQGIHNIKVLSRDMYGREFTQTKIIEIN